MLSEIVEEKITRDENITLEFFPNKTKLKSGKYGQAIKIPYGIHVKTGERSVFYNEAGEPVMDPGLFVDGIAKVSLSSIKKIIATSTKMNEDTPVRDVDMDISAYGDVGENIRTVLLSCSLLRFLCLKSVKTGYLTHQERLTVLYVFGHLGEEGKDFVHKVMSFTLNYKHDVTEHFIRRIPEKPISCVKLREQYKQLTAEFGCNCNFKRNRNCYPSPVLHAISSSQDTSDEVTMPVSRTLSKEKAEKMKCEMNLYNKVQEIALKLQEQKRQLRGCAKNVAKIERELANIFDENGIDELEIEMGVLCRRKTEKGTEWLIEI